MKKLFLALFVILSLNLDAQYITNHAKNIKQTEIDGLYYHLPRNIIRIDFFVEETHDYKGKYSAYAKELLNTDNYIKENKISYKIINMNISSLTEADPNHVFFISADEKNKENLNVNLELTSDGVIKSLGHKTNSTENTAALSIYDEIKYEDSMTEYNFISIRDEEDDDEEISERKLTDKETALSIIEEIKNIRLAYLDLITGYQEVNYGTTMNYMVERLKELENEYLSMFLGKTNKLTFTKSFYVIPEEGKNTVILSKFSDTEGFNNKVGENVKINFTDSSSASSINKLSKDEIENMTYNNKIFYRNPANVTMQILLGEDIISQNRLKISQLGNIILLPINKMKLTFDPNSGQILSVIKE